MFYMQYLHVFYIIVSPIFKSIKDSEISWKLSLLLQALRSFPLGYFHGALLIYGYVNFHSL